MKHKKLKKAFIAGYKANSKNFGNTYDEFSRNYAKALFKKWIKKC